MDLMPPLAGPQPELSSLGLFPVSQSAPPWAPPPPRDPALAWYLLSWTHLWGLGGPTKGPRREEAQEQEAGAPSMARFLLASHLSPS